MTGRERLSTKGDSFGNTRVTWTVKRKRMGTIASTRRGPRTICVRDHV